MNEILRNAFYEEADEVFEGIESCLLDIDGSGATKARVDELFRHMHTLKGSSAAMGITDMAGLTHHLEDVLGMMRDGKLTMSTDIANLMFNSLDELKLRVSKHRTDDSYEIDVNKYKNVLDVLISHKPASNGTLTQEGNVANANIRNGTGLGLEELGLEEKIYNISFKLEKDTLLKGARLYIVSERLKAAGRISKESWDSSDLENIADDSFEMVYITELAEKEIQDVLMSIPDVESVGIAELNTGHERQSTGSEIQSVIRVNINKLDKLLRIVEELSVEKERLKQQVKRVQAKYGKDHDIKLLDNLTQKIDFIGNEMQESVMSTRMYTLESVFNRYPRMVRDLSIKLGKKIELKLEGENTELDRSIIEKIMDPLNHIIRNSIDHGIEMPDEREKAGKRAQGTIKLSAGQEQGHVYIRVEDDGKGINTDKLRSIAVERGLLTREQADQTSDKDILEVIYLPSFSTNREVTDISGRGVGMNVVKENIEKINGIIEIDNRVGMGLTLTLKLPLTLAIIQSLLIRTSKYRFVLPLLSVIEVFKIKEVEYDNIVKSVQGREVMKWREEILAVIRASRLFNDQAGVNKSFIGIVLGFSTKKIILGVDEIIGQQQVVIKSLEKFTGRNNVLGDLKGISGTAILGDGDFAYVLDIQSIMKEINKQ